MKKTLLLFLILLLSLILLACSSTEKPEQSEVTSRTDETQIITTENLSNSQNDSFSENNTENNLNDSSGQIQEDSNSNNNITPNSTTNSSSIPSFSTTKKQTTPNSKPTTTSTNNSTTTKPKTSSSSPILTGITAKYIGKRAKTGDNLTSSDFEVIAQYSNNTTKKVSDYSIDKSVLNSIGNCNITIYYQNKTCSVSITVLEGNDPNSNPGSDFGYEIKNGELTITQYVGNKTDVIIPNWIDDMPVTTIKWLSNKVTSVVIPNNVKKLERKAFSSCNDLVSITLGANISEMGDRIFYQCNKLKNVTFKPGIKLISDGMFSSCPSIEQITLPDTVLSIGDQAFFFCTNLQYLSIPSSVNNIGDFQVLSGCSNLKQIKIVNNSYAQRWCLNNGYGEKLIYN